MDFSQCHSREDGNLFFYYNGSTAGVLPKVARAYAEHFLNYARDDIPLNI